MNRDLRLIDANAPVRREHTCDICGRRAPWGDGWQWYGSYLDYEDSCGSLRTAGTIGGPGLCFDCDTDFTFTRGGAAV